jgi:hypothetical protein
MTRSTQKGKEVRSIKEQQDKLRPVNKTMIKERYEYTGSCIPVRAIHHLAIASGFPFVTYQILPATLYEVTLLIGSARPVKVSKAGFSISKGGQGMKVVSSHEGSIHSSV